MRTLIQILAPSDQLIALCNDGSVWHMEDNGTRWERYPAIPQDDEPAPTLADTRWKPDGWPIWCVDTGDESVVACPNIEVFVRWSKSASARATVAPWVMVGAMSETAALHVWLDSQKPDTSIETKHIEFDGVKYPYLTDSIPF